MPARALVSRAGDRRAASRGRRPSRNVDGSTSSRLTFDRVHVRRGRDRDRRGGATAGTADAGIPDARRRASSSSASRPRALDVTLDYIKLRQQFGGRSAASRCCSTARSTASSISSSIARCVYRVLAAFDAGEHHPAMVSAVKARASRCALGDRSRRAADAWRHRLHRRARHRPLLQARDGARRAIRRRAQSYRPLLRPDARSRARSGAADACRERRDSRGAALRDRRARRSRRSRSTVPRRATATTRRCSMRC